MCTYLAGPSRDPSSGAADQLVDKAGANDEYSAIVAELEWPPGVTPPERSDELEGASYQVGVGATDAVMEWNCAWGRACLEARENDPAAAEHALTVYASFVDRPEFQLYFDPERAQPVVRGIIEDAELGDPSGVPLQLGLGLAGCLLDTGDVQAWIATHQAGDQQDRPRVMPHQETVTRRGPGRPRGRRHAEPFSSEIEIGLPVMTTHVASIDSSENAGGKRRQFSFGG